MKKFAGDGFPESGEKEKTAGNSSRFQLFANACF